MPLISVLLIILGVVLLGVACTEAAYRNGVRDGYSNPWLPRVRKQIDAERLTPHVPFQISRIPSCKPQDPSPRTSP